MDNVVKSKVETTVRSPTEPSERGPNSMVENHDQRDFSETTENTLLMSASSRVGLNIDQDKNDEIRNNENFEDGDFPALRPHYDPFILEETQVDRIQAKKIRRLISMKTSRN